MRAGSCSCPTSPPGEASLFHVRFGAIGLTWIPSFDLRLTHAPRSVALTLPSLPFEAHEVVVELRPEPTWPGVVAWVDGMPLDPAEVTVSDGVAGPLEVWLRAEACGGDGYHTALLEVDSVALEPLPDTAPAGLFEWNDGPLHAGVRRQMSQVFLEQHQRLGAASQGDQR